MAIRDGQTKSAEGNLQSSLNNQETKPQLKWAIDELNEDEDRYGTRCLLQGRSDRTCRSSFGMDGNEPNRETGE